LTAENSPSSQRPRGQITGLITLWNACNISSWNQVFPFPVRSSFSLRNIVPGQPRRVTSRRRERGAFFGSFSPVQTHRCIRIFFCAEEAPSRVRRVNKCWRQQVLCDDALTESQKSRTGRLALALDWLRYPIARGRGQGCSVSCLHVRCASTHRDDDVLGFPKNRGAF